jgi:hypothetical protein
MADMRWLSYRELADIWGVALPAAKARVRRARWRRQVGNDGVGRVEVPVEAVAPSPATDRATLPATEPATPSPLDNPAVALLVAELRAERDQARAEAVALRERIARLEGEAAGVRATAIADVATARAEVEATQKIVALLEEQLAESRRPWWRRWWS